MRRWRSGQSQQTVNLSPIGLRRFESCPTHNSKTGHHWCPVLLPVCPAECEPFRVRKSAARRKGNHNFICAERTDFANSYLPSCPAHDKGHIWAYRNIPNRDLLQLRQMKNKKGSATLVIILVVVIVLAVAGGVWYYNLHRTQSRLPSIDNSLSSTTTIIPIVQNQGCVMSSDTITSSSPLSDYTTEDLSKGMVCHFAIDPKLPIFTFRIAGQPDNSFGNIEVSEGTSTAIIQTIQNETEPWDPTSGNPEAMLTIVDANFDGYGDLSVLNNCGATGNCSYNFYLYDPTTAQFVYNSFLSDLGTPSFDEAKKQVVTSWNMRSARPASRAGTRRGMGRHASVRAGRERPPAASGVPRPARGVDRCCTRANRPEADGRRRRLDVRGRP